MKSTTNISKLKSKFTLKNATSFAGSKLILHFLEQIAFPKILKKLLRGKAPNATFPLSHVVLYLIIGWILGCRRIFQFRTLQEDSLIQQFMGNPLPHYSLLYKDLIRMGKDPSLVMKFQSLNQVLVEPLLPSSLILNFDSTIETVYGNQEGTAVGVNPHKPGRKSYHPLVVFEAQSQSCLNVILHPGNVHSSGANHVDLWIKVMAYNLFVRFKKQVCEPLHMSYTIQRFREEFFRIPGVITRHSRRVVIKMAQSFSKQRVWLQMERKVVLLE